ncbi:MAG: FAD-dependent oxidoreductase, partial [Alphaproteobacteria bacterium]|nr:FAD-dependent oxidoreductase [Alphaproteobacteria bacterium]
AALLWREAVAALGIKGAALPPHRVIKERRATARVAGGLKPRSGISGLLIAGGWSDRAYPDTIETAVRSGIEAAHCLAPPV